MVKKGARNLVLLSRSEASDKQKTVINELENQKVQVRVARVDICDFKELEQVFEYIDRKTAPIKGIIHAAGVLDDELLQTMTDQSLNLVMKPKVDGTWNLHRLSQNLSLDFFACFSSFNSLLGSPGQGNYAAANAFMDGLVYYRQQLGLPGLSINWGPWADAGLSLIHISEPTRPY